MISQHGRKYANAHTVDILTGAQASLPADAACGVSVGSAIVSRFALNASWKLALQSFG